jgi:hypothetical protein
MARGFESKDVEFQQAEAERSRTARLAPTESEQRDAHARRTLQLMLTRAQTELAATASPIRRDTLARAITELEQQLERADRAGRS